MDEAELGRLFGTYGYLVHRRCRSILQSPSDAEDALQEVFLRVSKYGGTQSGESVLAWLYSVTFNVCCDQMKRRRREQPEAPQRLAELDTRTVGSPEDSDRRAVVGAVLRSVGRRTREIVVLHHVSGMTQEEVASETGYSRKTVGKKLQAFSDRLRRSWRPSKGDS